jgi:micrococcal nuclease
VIDGDTFTLHGTRYRIANIDAPELHEGKCDAERRLAFVARVRLGALLSSGTIRIIPGDPVDGRLKDRYGRSLATVTVDGRDVGDILVSERLARSWKGRRTTWC